MLDGSYFYWFSWITWIIATFFMKKNNLRLKLAVIILLLLIVVPYHFSVSNYSINIGLALLYTYSFLEISSHKSSINLSFFYITTFTITIGYVGFQLLELFDPVWLFVDRNWLLAIALSYVITFLIKETYERIICLLISTCQGEFLFAIILQKFNVEIEVGSLMYFDMLSISFIILQGWHLLNSFAVYLNAYMQKQYRQRQG